MRVRIDAQEYGEDEIVHRPELLYEKPPGEQVHLVRPVREVALHLMIKLRKSCLVVTELHPARQLVQNIAAPGEHLEYAGIVGRGVAVHEVSLESDVAPEAPER